MEPGWLWDTVRSLVMWLESVVYGLVQMLLQLIFDLASIDSIITMDAIQEFTDRIYLVVGIYMLFRLSFSLLNAIVNPDHLTEKEKGTSKIIFRAITAVVMLAVFPLIYTYSFRLQAAILPTLPQLILGRDFGVEYEADELGNIIVKEQTEDGVNVETMGESISWIIYQSFFQVNEECGANSGQTLESIGVDSIDRALQYVNVRCPSDGGTYQFDYSFPGVAMLVGIGLVIVLLGYVIDVAIRVFKLTVIRIVAPIPIISYVEPKSAKQGAFANFIKLYVSTYIDLFVKLGVLYIGIYFLDAITDAKVTIGENRAFGEDPFRTGLVIIALIIGIFLFMKQAPKFIKDIFGIKGSGSLGLNAMMAGTGAFLSGAGIGGAMSATGAALEQGTDAINQGKQIGGGYGAGRDLAAQLKTGDPKAKGKSLFQKAMDVPMQMGARAHGFGKNNVAETKQAMYSAKDAASTISALSASSSRGQLKPKDHEYIKHNYKASIKDLGLNENIDQWTESDWSRLVNKENTNAAMAESHYKKAEAQSNIRGIDNNHSTYKDATSGIGPLRRHKATKHSRKNEKPPQNP